MEVVIPLGSIVVVDLDDRQFIDKKVYCVNFPQAGGDIADVKRVQKWNEGGFILISDNTAKFPPEISHLDWKDLCVGRVVWMWKDIRNI